MSAGFSLTGLMAAPASEVASQAFDPGPYLISDGEILTRNLRRERMTVDEIRGEARPAVLASLRDFKYAVPETMPDQLRHESS